MIMCVTMKLAQWKVLAVCRPSYNKLVLCCLESEKVIASDDNLAGTGERMGGLFATVTA